MEDPKVNPHLFCVGTKLVGKIEPPDKKTLKKTNIFSNILQKLFWLQGGTLVHQGITTAE